jgi:hypothetical protein
MGAIVLTVVALTFVALSGGNNTAQREGPQPGRHHRRRVSLPIWGRRTLARRR